MNVIINRAYIMMSQAPFFLFDWEVPNRSNIEVKPWRENQNRLNTMLYQKETGKSVVQPYRYDDIFVQINLGVFS